VRNLRRWAVVAGGVVAFAAKVDASGHAYIAAG
jgi:hypothetical protein